MGADRAGEAEGLSFGGAREKKRPAGKPGNPFLDGEKKPHEGEAVFAGGDDKKRHGRVDKPAHLFLNAKRKKLDDSEATPLFPGGESENLRADEPVHILSDGDKKKPHSYQGEAAPLFPGGDAKKRSISVCEETSPKRTPSLIAEALQSNGPPPRHLIHMGSESDEEDEKEDPVALALYWRGVEREDRYDPYVDYFFVGRPQPDSWYQIWRERPLNLHDAEMVAAVDSVILWGPGLRTPYLDVSDHVTRVLENHPGPVSTLRLDASEFPGQHHLTRWMRLLSLKQAKEVILINVTRTIEETQVQLDQLCSRGLTYLGVGFINLRDCLRKALVSAGEDGHPWSTLTHLSLTACLFFGPHLARTVKDLWGLRILRIGNSELTQGCDEENGLQIESPNLVMVVFSSCTAATKLVLGRAPKMAVLQLGVRAVSFSDTSPPIHIQFCEGLLELNGLSLPVTLWSSYTRKVNRKSMLSFRCLRNLVTTVDMTTIGGTQALFDFLTMVPHLKRLTVSGMVTDQISPHLTQFPELPTRWSHFTGGRGEVTFLLEILATAKRLVSVSVAVNPDAAMPMSLKEAAEFLKARSIASKKCRIRVGP